MRAARRAISVVDLGFGDAGKGTTIDWLTRQTGARLVVRFNGGPQAGHNVVEPDGTHHTFSQFGSGTFAGARTLLSRDVLIEPFAMRAEAAHLHDRCGIREPFAGLLIDGDCKVITPVQVAANRLRELARGDACHGTCGMGVGECVSDAIGRPELVIHARDLSDRARIRRLLTSQLEAKRRELAWHGRPARADPHGHEVARSSRRTESERVLDDHSWIEPAIDVYERVSRSASILTAAEVRALLERESTILFEGAQGVLLDEDVGFHPHTTWSRTTFANADAVLDAAGFDGEHVRWGVTRCYATRHGAGPLPSEALGWPLPEPHNDASGWQGGFRVGHFDAVLVDYALACVGRLDGVVVTHLDRIGVAPGDVCVAYERADLPRYDKDSPIPHLSPSDFEGRAALTNRLSRVRPVLDESVPRDADAFVDWFERRFAQRVVLRSAGPTHRQKQLLTGSCLSPSP